MIDDGIRYLHVGEILDYLEMEFNYHYERIFDDGEIGHLHKAEAIKNIVDWIVDDSTVDVTEEENDWIGGWISDIKRMKDYLEIYKEDNNDNTD